jgi:hypothetical protein
MVSEREYKLALAINSIYEAPEYEYMFEYAAQMIFDAVRAIKEYEDERADG